MYYPSCSLIIWKYWKILEKPLNFDPFGHARFAPVSGSGTAVKAPMPGTILKVNVTAGQSVKAGDIMFILEAMKMENEIVAPSDGTVSQVVAAKGSSVATDDVLAYLN